MNKALSLAVGAGVLVLGLILLMKWWYEFVFVLCGTVPALLVLGGAVACVAGYAELKDVLKAQEKTEEKK